MKTKKFIFIILLYSCVITGLTGCFPSADGNNKVNIETLDSYDKNTQNHITETLDHISIDADITYPQSNSFDIYNAKMTDFDFDKLKSIFIKKKENISVIKDKKQIMPDIQHILQIQMMKISLFSETFLNIQLRI